jgi:hypothetical protein
MRLRRRGGGFLYSIDPFVPFRTRALSIRHAQPVDLRAWLEQAPINRDRDLRMEYLAGLGLNHNEQGQVYLGMFSCRKFPQALFTGREAQQKALWELIERQPGSQ